MRDDEYNSSQLNVWELWDKIKQEREDKNRTELHAKRIEEIKKLERTCCKCKHEIPDSELPPSQPPATCTADTPASCTAGTLPAVTAGTLPAGPSTSAVILNKAKPTEPTEPVILNEAKRSEGPMHFADTTTNPAPRDTIDTIQATENSFAQQTLGMLPPRFSDFAISRFCDFHQSVMRAKPFKTSVVARCGGEGGD